MGNHQDDRSRRPDQAGPEPRRDREGRAFERHEDMGGSVWSGASGRGGMSSEGGDPSQGGYPPQGGFPREGGYPRDRDSGYSREGGYRELYGHHEPHGASRAGSYPREGADNAGGYARDSGFPREEGFGHVPGQRWSGGYGGDVDRPNATGRGFSGSDFAPSSQPRSAEQRHFGNEVDRGGRTGRGESTTAREHWGGHGFQGTDMGMGARDDERGPHYGKGPKGYQRSDARIHDEVCEAIAHQGHIDASDVEVTVESGVVTLNGTVTHRGDKRGLEHLLERLRGVDEVRNELRLKRPPRAEPPAAAPQPQGNGGDVKDQKNGKAARS